MNKKATTMLLLFLVFLGMEVALSNATVVSPPQQIQLEGGEEDNAGNWKGGYWTFTVSVDQADSLVGRVTLPANTTEKGEAGSEVKTRKTIEIQIAPKKAYYRRMLKLAPIEDRIVSPKTFKGSLSKVWGTCGWDTSVSIDSVVAEYYTWAESSWQKYTAFDVSVYIEGKLQGTTTFNTETGTKDLMINTTKGTMLIKNLGRLEGDYTEPQVPSEVVIFNDNYVFSGDAVQYIRFDHGRQVKYWASDKSYLMYIENSNAYSTFWFGTVRWNPNSVGDKEVADGPAPFNNPGLTGYDIIAPEKGWKGCDSLWDLIREPVLPAIYPEEGDNSLIWYINKMCSVGNIADTWLAGYDWNIEQKDGKPNAVIVDMPWGAYSGAPIVTFYVPSELAETWVYRPPISDVRIQNAIWLDGSDILQAGKKKCQLELKQYARVNSSATIYAETTTTRASVKPTSITVTMAPNETKTVTFEVSDLGVDANTTGTVMFTVKRSWDGVQTSVSQLSFKLVAPVLPDDYNKTNVIDRTGPPEGTDPAKVSEGTPTLALVVIVCATAIAITLMALFVRNKSYRDATKKAAKGTANLAKTVVKPFYARNPGATTACIIGAVVFFGLLFNMKWLPWLRAFPIDVEIPFVGGFHSDWFWILGTFVGFVSMVCGFWKLLVSRVPQVVQPVQIVIAKAAETATKVVTEGTKKISDYFKKED